MVQFPPVGMPGAATSAAPAYAGANPFDSARSTYNLKASNTRRTRMAQGRAQAGTGVLRVLVGGDSTSDSFVGTAFDQVNMWPWRMRSRLAAAGLPTGGTGWVKIGGWSPTADPRITLTGGMVRSYLNYPCAIVSATTDTATLSSFDGLGTSIGIAYWDGAAGSFTYVAKDASNATVDSGTVNLTNTNTTKVFTKAGLTNVQSLTVTAGNAPGLTALAINRTSGLIVDNWSQYGSRVIDGSYGWIGQNQPAGGPLGAALAATPDPDVLILPLGVNDMLGGADPVATAAGLATLRASWPNADAMLLAQYQPAAVATAAWQSYVTAMYRQADTLDVPLIDLYDRSGGYAIANARGMMGDGTHPGVPAQPDQGRVMANVIST